MSIKSHYSAAELVAMRLPGLPATIQGLGLRAKHESWASRKRQGRGGGREFALTSLPQAAQDFIRTAAARELLASLPVPGAAQRKAPALRDAQLALPLTTEQQTIEGARLGVLAHIEELMQGCGLTKERAIHH
ncbi:MAG: DNA-binding protein, partial [Vogesella sp.]|uniref:DNA-binding protein n=1 Tax=Vogesella sp. TaxID=1904252 RepID=UPI003F2F2117